MSIYYSKTTKGFYHSGIHRDIPTEAVEVDKATYESLLAGQADGMIIVANETGYPVLANADSSYSDNTRKYEIHKRLNQIDLESIRPLRAKLNNSATPEDDKKLADLEIEAEKLRTELDSIVAGE